MSQTCFVARRILAIEQSAQSVDVLVEAVQAQRTDAFPSAVVTAEDPAEQMARSNTPNRPPLAERPEWASRTVRLRVSFVGSSSVRLVATWADAAEPQRDFGMLVDDVPHPRRPAVDGTILTAAGSGLSVHLDMEPFDLRVEDDARGELLRLATDDLNVHGLAHVAGLALSDAAAEVGFALKYDERLYGLGERFDGLNHRGHQHRLWNADALATTTSASYKNVPLLLSSRGYGVFFHTPARVDVDLGATSVTSASVSVAEPVLDVFVLGGGSLKQLLGAYTELTGRSPRIPRWALGVWMSRCRYESQAEVEAIAERLRAEDIPCDVLHIDPAWLALPNLNCDFVVNTEQFPDFGGMLARLAQQHFRVSVWELPYVSPLSPVHAEASANGYFAKLESPLEGIQPADGLPRAIVDFTSAEATGWWQSRHQQLLDWGVAVFKTDFGEALPADAHLSSGARGAEVHNMYALLYNRAVFEATAAARPDQPVMVWGRSGWAGSQRYPAQWSGDPQTSAEAMAACLRGGLSYSLSAPGWWSVDIGGFYGPPPSAALYIRWTQFGMLCPLARAHGTTPREPWEFGPQALEVFRDFARLRYRLTPYLERCGEQATQDGLPVLRPLLLEFEHDPVTAGIDDQYLLGPDLLVAPVFSDAEMPAHRRIYLPSGAEWVDFWTGERYAGGQLLDREIPLERIPLFVRSGADLGLLPEDPRRQWIDQV